MAVITRTVTICDRCGRGVPSGVLYPIVAGPPGITQITINVCEDIVNNCRVLCTAVIAGPITDIPPSTDGLLNPEGR